MTISYWYFRTWNVLDDADVGTVLCVAEGSRACVSVISHGKLVQVEGDYCMHLCHCATTLDFCYLDQLAFIVNVELSDDRFHSHKFFINCRCGCFASLLSSL